MYRNIIIVICILITGLSSAQKSDADSLYLLLRKKPHDTIVAKLHFKLGNFYAENDAAFDSALVHYKLCAFIANEAGFNRLVLYALRDLGHHFVNNGSTDSAIYYYNKGLSYVTNKKETIYMDLLSGIGNGYFLEGNYLKAYDYYLKYMQQAEISGTLKQKARAYSNVGVILKEQKKYDEALKHFKKALEMGKKAGDEKSIYISYVNTGNVYNEKSEEENNPDLNLLALENYNKALPIALDPKKPDNRIGAILLLGNIGNIYADLKEYDKAIKEYDHAIKLMDEEGYFPQSALVYNNLSGIYLDMKDLKNAQKFLKKGEEASLRSDSPDNMAQLYETYARYYEMVSDFPNAYKSHVLYKKYSDSLFNTDNAEKRRELELNFEFEKKEAATRAEQEKKEEIAKQEKQKQLIILNSFIAGFVLMLLLAFFIFRGYRGKKKANEIITLQKDEVERAKQIIEKQKDLVEEKQKEILDSIHYAKRIQHALFASDSTLEKNLSGKQNYFVYFKPKDIVSGDFYWVTENTDSLYLAVCDSTGHGVPGAFMSLLNIGFISEAINEHNILSPEKVFDYVRKRLVDSISQDGQKDGFDGILLRRNKSTRKITYAAANNRPVLVSNNGIKELECDKMPVGKGEKDYPFNLFSIETNGFLYLYTDGYADQFGGPKGKKFKYKQLNELLNSISMHNTSEQTKLLSKRFEEWKGDLEQVDDVLVFGIKV